MFALAAPCFAQFFCFVRWFFPSVERTDEEPTKNSLLELNPLNPWRRRWKSSSLFAARLTPSTSGHRLLFLQPSVLSRVVVTLLSRRGAAPPGRIPRIAPIFYLHLSLAQFFSSASVPDLFLEPLRRYADPEWKDRIPKIFMPGRLSPP